MRLFLGVELDERLRTACAAAARDLQARLQDAGAGRAVRWVPEGNLHITLSFLGEVREDRVPGIAEALHTVEEIGTFPFEVSGAGIFPASGPPRVLWLGITEGAEGLGQLYSTLDSALAGSERRPYHPHITIGRLRDGDRSAARGARAIVQSARVRPGSGRIDSVTLFQSHLSPGGARYERLLRVPLKGC